MKSFKNYLQNWIKHLSVALIFGFIACGDQENLKITPGSTPVSNIDLKGSPQPSLDSPQAKSFFIERLWPIMSGDSEKGCTECHSAGGSYSQTFFQVDTDNSENSWNWARVRRFKLEASDYLDLNTNSSLISMRRTTNHATFENWTDEEKALITEWVDLP
jgi:hypothetical protein